MNIQKEWLDATVCLENIGVLRREHEKFISENPELDVALCRLENYLKEAESGLSEYSFTLCRESFRHILECLEKAAEEHQRQCEESATMREANIVCQNLHDFEVKRDFERRLETLL
jgi:hypothetical protein